MFWFKSVGAAKKAMAGMEALNKELYRKQFREGDKVYVNDGVRDQLTPYYLRKGYNGGTCYYVTASKEGLVVESLNFSVSIQDISHNKPKCCATCNQLL